MGESTAENERGAVPREESVEAALQTRPMTAEEKKALKEEYGKRQ